jgi:hypothetical protein
MGMSPDQYAGWLRLKGSAITLDDAEAPPVFLGRRQQYFDGEITARLDFQPTRVGEAAGLALRMNDRHHYEFGIRQAPGGQREVYLRYSIGSLHPIAATRTIKSGFVRRIIRNSTFLILCGDDAFQDLGRVGPDSRFRIAMASMGVFVGMFAHRSEPG